MALTPGVRLGAYEILGLIGAGGMGEVYKARNTRLDRTVAIKVVPASVATDPERRHRFEQEARAVSALNHPHICVLHDIGRAGETDFLVMEYLDGQTLAEQLAKGPLPLEQALRVATDVADALAAAHKQGIVHRDLKPGNVMLTKAGAKLLDFGLARLTQGSGATGDSRTVTDETIPKGTVPYMAPEHIPLAPTIMIAVLGHELRHALEIAAMAEVRDEVGLWRAYRRIGFATRAGGFFETEAALATEARVGEEAERAARRARSVRR